MLQIITTQEAFEKLIRDAVILAVNNITKKDLLSGVYREKTRIEELAEKAIISNLLECRTINSLKVYAHYENLNIDFHGSINQLSKINIRKFRVVRNVGNKTIKDLEDVLKKYNIKSTR